MELIDVLDRHHVLDLLSLRLSYVLVDFNPQSVRDQEHSLDDEWRRRCQLGE